MVSWRSRQVDSKRKEGSSEPNVVRAEKDLLDLDLEKSLVSLVRPIPMEW